MPVVAGAFAGDGAPNTVPVVAAAVAGEGAPKTVPVVAGAFGGAPKTVAAAAGAGVTAGCSSSNTSGLTSLLSERVASSFSDLSG